jgi:uncharacterized UPF0160 family protein
MTKVGTHPSVFDSEEIIAIALITFIDDVEIIRSRSTLVLGECEILVGVGREYDPRKSKYDHHQFLKDDLYYGFSSAGLVWKDLRESFKRLYKDDLEDLDAFIKAVDARCTRVNYDPSNLYEPVFDSFAACNHVEPNHKNQDKIFREMIDIARDIIYALVTKDAASYNTVLQKLEERAAITTSEKEAVFLERKRSAVILPDVVISKFFDSWRALSKAAGKPIVMPGDEVGQYKIMLDTTKHRIITAKDAVFVHQNGFIAVVEPSETIAIILSNGVLCEIRKKVVDSYLARMK